MTTEATTSLQSLMPVFVVERLQAALEFYAEKLGFQSDVMLPTEAPYVAIVRRDGATLMLKEIAPGVRMIPNHLRHAWAPWDAFVSTADPDALAHEFEQRGVTLHRPVMDASDGLRTFEVMDKDGYVIAFGRPISAG